MENRKNKDDKVQPVKNLEINDLIAKKIISYTLVAALSLTAGIKIGSSDNSNTNSNSSNNNTEVLEEELVDVTYKIVAGDTLINIANKFNKKVEEIKKVNQIKDGNYIYTGETLIIPSVDKKLADDYYNNEIGTTDIVYIVQSGDTIEGISEKFGVTKNEIIEKNNIKYENRIDVGQELIIPDISIVTLEEEENYEQNENENENNNSKQEALGHNSLNCKGLGEGYFRVIDISENQGNIDWNKLEEEYKEGTFTHIILRINENIGLDRKTREFRVDSSFEKYLSECNKRSIPYGVYSFSRATTVEQVNEETNSLINYINTELNRQKKVNGETLDLTFNLSLPIYMDCFENDAVSQTKLLNSGNITQCLNIVDTWCENMENAGYFTGVYINSNTCNKLGENNLSKYTLWIANYPTSRVINAEDVTLTGNVRLDQVIRGHQITETGKINGIDGYVDVSVFDENLLQIFNAYKKSANILTKVIKKN